STHWSTGSISDTTEVELLFTLNDFYKVTRLDLLPRSSVGTLDLYPGSVKIYVSNNNIDFELIVDDPTLTRPGSQVWQSINIETAGAKYIKVVFTPLTGQTYVQIAEMQLIGHQAEAPQITSAPVATAYRTQAYSYQVQSTDPQSDTITYAIDATSSTAGLSINSSTGLVIWSPSSSAVDQDVVITVSDGTLVNQQSYQLSVVEPEIVTPIPTHSGESWYEYSSYYLSKALDNDSSTHWSTGSISDTTEVELLFTLNDFYKVTRLDLLPRSSVGTLDLYPGSVKIYVSNNNIDFELIIDESSLTRPGSQVWQSINIETEGANYIKVVFTPLTGATYVQIAEMQFFGHKAEEPQFYEASYNFTTNYNSSFTHQVSVSDPQLDTLTYSVDATSSNIGFSITTDGLLSWQPNLSHVDSTAKVIVSDGVNTVNAIYNINLEGGLLNGSQFEVSASTVEEYYPVTNLLDGNTETRWASYAGPTQSAISMVFGLATAAVLTEVELYSNAIALTRKPINVKLYAGKNLNQFTLIGQYDLSNMNEAWYQIDIPNELVKYLKIEFDELEYLNGSSETEFSAQFSEVRFKGVIGDVPVILSEPSLAVVGGQTYTYQIVAEDPNGISLTYSATSSSSNLSLVGDTIYFTTSATSVSFDVSLIVSNGSDSELQAWSVDILDYPLDNMIIDPSSSLSEYKPSVDMFDDDNGTYWSTVSISTADIQSLVLDLNGVIDVSMITVGGRAGYLNFPEKIKVFTSNDGINFQERIVVTGYTPNAEENVVINLTKEVSKYLKLEFSRTSGSGYIQVTELVVIGKISQSPIITSLPIEMALNEELYQYQVVAEDNQNDVLEFNISTSAVNAGLSIDINTGLISWTPTTSLATESVTVYVDDSVDTYSQDFNIFVEDPEISLSNPTHSGGSFYEYSSYIFDNMLDGVDATRWSTASIPDKTVPVELLFTLDQIYLISEIKTLARVEDSTFHPKKVEIFMGETSGSLSLVVSLDNISLSNGEWKNYSLPKTSAKFIKFKFYCENDASTQYIQLGELVIKGVQE
ncbi:MAG: hypothetical protein COA79_21335, partial [Planctomycetota bacterium]